MNLVLTTPGTVTHGRIPFTRWPENLDEVRDLAALGVAALEEKFGVKIQPLERYTIVRHEGGWCIEVEGVIL